MTEVYAFATGKRNIFFRTSRLAAEIIGKQPGYIAINIVDGELILWIFDTLNNAKMARNRAKAEGLNTGRKIMLCDFDERRLRVIRRADQ